MLEYRSTRHHLRSFWNALWLELWPFLCSTPHPSEVSTCYRMPWVGPFIEPLRLELWPFLCSTDLSDKAEKLLSSAVVGSVCCPMRFELWPFLCMAIFPSVESPSKFQRFPETPVAGAISVQKANDVNNLLKEIV